MAATYSLSAQVILRGTRSAGYGFVAVATETAAQKAVELLNKQELDGREVIVEVAKPADQKDKEKKQRKLKRKPGRRGSKAVPGEVSEAEANGDVAKAEGAPATEEGAKPKKKKKSSVSVLCGAKIVGVMILMLRPLSAARRPARLPPLMAPPKAKALSPALRWLLTVPLLKLLQRSPVCGSHGPLALPVPPARTLSASRRRASCSSQT